MRQGYAWLRSRGPLSSLGPRKSVATLMGYGRFWSDWHAYQRLPGAESLRFLESYPQVNDRTVTTVVDSHYFYQAIWASRLILRDQPAKHIDVGSDHRMVGLLACVLPIGFVDIRPLQVKVDNLSGIAGSIVALPFRENSVDSLSCLHVAEHVGLGRYGDQLDPLGTRKACVELSRVLAPGGNLYFSLPVGHSRVEFNAHRIHTPTQILEYFPNLNLVEFSAVTDAGIYVQDVQIDSFASATYACGLFWFRKR